MLVQGVVGVMEDMTVPVLVGRVSGRVVAVIELITGARLAVDFEGGGPGQLADLVIAVMGVMTGFSDQVGPLVGGVVAITKGGEDESGGSLVMQVGQAVEWVVLVVDSGPVALEALSGEAAVALPGEGEGLGVEGGGLYLGDSVEAVMLIADADADISEVGEAFAQVILIGDGVVGEGAVDAG